MFLSTPTPAWRGQHIGRSWGCCKTYTLGQRMGLHSSLFRSSSPRLMETVTQVPAAPDTRHWYHQDYRHPDTCHWYHLRNTFGEFLKTVVRCPNAFLNDWKKTVHVIFASEWCNSKAMIESKTIKHEAIYPPEYFPYFFRYSVFSLRDVCQEPWVMGLLSTGNISHSGGGDF